MSLLKPVGCHNDDLDHLLMHSLNFNQYFFLSFICLINSDYFVEICLHSDIKEYFVLLISAKKAKLNAPLFNVVKTVDD